MKLIEKLEASEIIRLQDRTGEGLYFDLTHDMDVSSQMSDTTVKAALDHNAWRELIKNTEEVEIVYNPNDSRKFIPGVDAHSVGTYNTYNAPRILDKSIDPRLPECLDVFFKHFIPSKESREYVFDWLHTMLVSRNYTMLVLVGGQGIGKGTFGAIVNQLVGKHNFHGTTGNKMLTGRFNGELENKQAVFFDEFHLRTSNKEALAALKGLINDEIAIEGKGKEAKYIKNQANFFMATNVFEGIPVEHGDRRFSVIDLTTKETRFNVKLQEYINSKYLFSEEIIARFHAFLLARNPDPMKMLQPFEGELKSTIALAARPEWVNVLAQDFGEDGFIRLSVAQNAIREHCSGVRVGRPTIGRWFRLELRREKAMGFEGEDRCWYIDCSKVLKGC